ncbi:MAG: 2-phosphosulfolactate phosphatase [Betaproteobacteria bacterium]|jgi:2-phosphosulfolactate phosphatase|nr:2-phosphosulfolactate phosphatase [Betaproteobacteria bacterium]
MILNHKVHVLTRKEEVDTVRLPGKVVIVLDVLFATSTIANALAHGARAVTPALDEASARAEGARHSPESVVLAGELYAETLPGFASPMPQALVADGVAGKHVVYSTTNGTVALMAMSRSEHIYAAALLNGQAVIEHVLGTHPDSTILIVCAGTMGHFNFEDFYGAGYLVELIAQRLGEQVDYSDAARAARLLFGAREPLPSLLDCRVGRMMAERGFTHEVEYAAQLSVLQVVPIVEDSRIIALG